MRDLLRVATPAAGEPIRSLPRPPALAQLTSGRIFYGWYVALACTVMMYVAVGVSYSLGDDSVLRLSTGTRITLVGVADPDDVAVVWG